MTEPLPVMAGYLVKSLWMTPTEEHRSRSHLLSFAEQQGYQMPTIFVEETATESTALRELIQFAHGGTVQAVAVTGVEELQRQHREQLTGVEVLFTAPPP